MGQLVSSSRVRRQQALGIVDSGLHLASRGFDSASSHFLFRFDRADLDDQHFDVRISHIATDLKADFEFRCSLRQSGRFSKSVWKVIRSDVKRALLAVGAGANEYIPYSASDSVASTSFAIVRYG